MSESGLEHKIKAWKNPEKKFTGMAWAYTDTKASIYYESTFDRIYRLIKRELKILEQEWTALD